MKQEDTYRYLGKYSKIRLGMMGVFLVYLLVRALIENNVEMGKGCLIMASAILFADIVCEIFSLWKRKVPWVIIRGVELTIFTYYFFEEGISSCLVFYVATSLITMLELFYAYDITNPEHRSGVLAAGTVPAVIMVLLKIAQKEVYSENMFGLVCAFGMLLYMADRIAAATGEQIAGYEENLFEQKRLAEFTKETNRALYEQQEKVKRTNEELGLQKIKLEEANQKINNVNSEMMIQNSIMKYISTSLEINTLMEYITESVLESSGLNLCAIVLKPGVVENETAIYEIRTRLSEDANRLLEEYISNNYLDSYVESKQVFVDNYIKENTYPFIRNNEVCSLMILPLVNQGTAMGAILCGHGSFDYFEDNLSFYETIVSQFLVALNNANLYAKMQQMAHKDALSGLYNRGHLNYLVDQCSKEAVEQDTALSIALFDIDHFKKINDTYGHLFGDVVIKEISRLASQIAKQYEGIAGRYGGEEFVLVFPGKDVGEAKAIMEELRTQIGELKIEHEGDLVRTRVSVGLACYPDTCTRINELLNRADNAMYESKDSGGNAVTIDSRA